MSERDGEAEAGDVGDLGGVVDVVDVGAMAVGTGAGAGPGDGKGKHEPWRFRRARIAHGAEHLAQRVADAGDAAIHCDVLVVGSGYGGAVAAARLAGARRSDGTPAAVWLLERGNERRPGDFPSRFGELAGEVRFSRPGPPRIRGNAEGLFDLRLGDDVHVLVGNGLGGGSLINAGVMARPLPEIWQSGWPAALAADRAGLDRGYEAAGMMIRPDQIPDDAPPKLQALRAVALAKGVADEDGQHDHRCRVAVNFGPKDSDSAAGLPMGRCKRAGDCVTGCNQGAKHTLDTNYLAWARRGGAELFCGATVLRVEPQGSAGDRHWRVWWTFTAPGKRTPQQKPFSLRARRVLLAAGTLGSTAILKRSSAIGGLAVSNCLGARFSTNGDQLVAAFRQPALRSATVRSEETDAGIGPHETGPTITGLVRDRVGNGIPIAVEEFAVPAALGDVFGEIVTTFGFFHSMFTGLPAPHAADGGCDALAVTPSSREYTLLLGMMGDDGAPGRLHREVGADAGADALCDADLRVEWAEQAVEAGYGGTPRGLLDLQTDWLRQACKSPALGGTIVPNPLWRILPERLDALFGRRGGTAFSVHPLGGCAMADDAQHGVVDHLGQVFDGNGGTHEGLAVLDGSIVPRALAINPSLTIAALAERALPALATRWGLVQADQTAPAGQPLGADDERPPRRPAAARATAIRIKERMIGRLRLGAAGAPVDVALEVKSLQIADLAGFLRSATHHEKLDEGGDFASELRVGSAKAATLGGHVDFFVPTPLAALAHAGAGLAAVQLLVERLRSASAGASLGGAIELTATLAPLLATLKLARELRYRFVVKQPGESGLQTGDVIVGVKRLAFDKDAGPWHQLTTMSLTLERAGTSRPLGELRADLGYFAEQRQMLAVVTAQRDQPTALLDLAALALFTLRVLMLSQFPHFVPAGDMVPRIDARRSQALDGGPFATCPVGDDGALLSRYGPPAGGAKGRAVLLIHGLSAAGSTFSHPAIPGNLVRTLRNSGRDVWVLDLSSSSIEPPQGQPRPAGGSFEAIADRQIGAAVDKVLEVCGQSQLDIVAHCIGSAMFIAAMLGDKVKNLHQKIGCAVLSQVAPLTRLGPANRLRGYLASFVQQFLEMPEIDVRGDWQRNAQGQWQANPRLQQAALLVDALLASLPSDEGGDEAARAAALAKGPGEGARDFRRLRHRVDALIGQTFPIENLADETLLALDGIYGWVKTAMLAQVLYMAREGVVTEADGCNRRISGHLLRERFSFPVLLLHGRRNRVFDWQGSYLSWRELDKVFGAGADVPGAPDALAAAALPADKMPAGGVDDGGDWVFGSGERRQLRVLRRYGHQDCMIGAGAQHDVFRHIVDFLDADLPKEKAGPPEASFDCAWPWMGVMLGWLRPAAGAEDAYDVSLLVHPGPGRAQTERIVFVPLNPADGTPDFKGLRWLRRKGKQDQRDMLTEHALTLRLTKQGDAVPQYAVVVLRRRIHNAQATLPKTLPGQEEGTALELEEAEHQAVVDYLKSPKKIPPNCILRLDKAQLAAADRPDSNAASKLHFVVASCQFPPGLSDKEVAGAAYRRLEGWLDAKGKPQPGFLLLLGDQVYLDALANAFESPLDTPEQRARRAYELNWRLAPLRRVAARLPSYMLLDDHEVEDNWQPHTPADPPASAALAAYRQHQAKLAPPALAPDSKSFSYTFAPAGLPFFVLDTRSRREARGVAGSDTAVGQAHIAAKGDLAALEAWLLAHKASPVKFIATDSVLLPLDRHATPTASIEERLGFDSWSGYPASLCRLLAFIDREQIDGVVLLAGDAHLSAVVRLTFDRSLRRVHAIMSSGLYSPWPFANARKEDFIMSGKVKLAAGGHGFAAKMEMGWCAQPPGWTLVSVQPGAGAGGVQVTATYVPADPHAEPTPWSFEP